MMRIKIDGRWEGRRVKGLGILLRLGDGLGCVRDYGVGE